MLEIAEMPLRKLYDLMASEYDPEQWIKRSTMDSISSTAPSTATMQRSDILAMAAWSKASEQEGGSWGRPKGITPVEGSQWVKRSLLKQRDRAEQPADDNEMIPVTADNWHKAAKARFRAHKEHRQVCVPRCVVTD